MRRTIYAIAAAAIIGTGIYVLVAPESAETPALPGSSDRMPTGNASADVATELVGTWMSEDDALYTVEYRADGSLVERYDLPEAPVSERGTWRVEPDAEGAMTLITVIAGETYTYAVVAFEDGRMTIRERSAVSDNHFIKRR
jgi:hypothetical protein